MASIANWAARQQRAQAQVGRPLLRKCFEASSLADFSQGKSVRMHMNPESTGALFPEICVPLTPRS